MMQKKRLNNGTLTLKAGSKVYIPNGFEADGTTPKFDMAVSEKDISSNSSWTSGQVILIPQKGLTYGMYSSQISNHYSGSTEPATKIDGTIWYDIANNLIKRYSTSNSEWESGLPFPICISTMTSGVGLISIDQVFNGFGYIGSTVFALPGVKVQIPNGRNEDGTYRIIPYTTQNVITREVTGTGVKDITLQPNGILNWAIGGVYFAEDGYHHGYIVSSINISAVLARVLITTAGKIDSFVSRNVVSVVNSNASNFSQAGRSYLSGLGMPSSRYIDLTLLASGNTYTAPANGWFNAQQNISTNATVNVGMLAINTTTNVRVGEQNNFAGYHVNSVLLPVKKGEAMALYYYEYTSISHFKFFYDEGEN